MYFAYVVTKRSTICQLCWTHSFLLYLLNHYCSNFVFGFAVYLFFWWLACPSILASHSFRFRSIKIVLFIYFQFFCFLFLWLISMSNNCFRPFWFTCWTCILLWSLKKNCKYLLLLFNSLSVSIDSKNLLYSNVESQSKK